MISASFPDRIQIEAAQLDGLRGLLKEIAAGNRFYGPRLMKAGIEPGAIDLRGFRSAFPFTLKTELAEDQVENPPFGTNLTYPLDRYTRYSQTSGTSGAPIRWLDTQKTWSWMVDNWVEIFRSGGVTDKDRVFFAFSFGPFLGFWTAYGAAQKVGCLCIPGGGMSTSARLRTILDTRCTVLCCTPTYAAYLGDSAREEDIDLSRSAVRLIFAAGEPGASIPATRDRIESLWPGARIIDHHGMTEVGPVSVECSSRRGVLHILEHAFISEVVDPSTGEAVSPGEEGELVLTNLGRAGSPLLRYRTGDLVRLDDRPAGVACECGRYDMGLVGGILGRTDDMVVVRGVNVHPSAVEAVVREFDHIAEYRVRLITSVGMDELEIDIEPVPHCREPEALAETVEAALRDAFNLRIPAKCMEVGTLPRFEMKARRWVRVEASGEENRHARRHHA